MQVRNASSIHGSGYESNSENDWLQQDDYLSIAPGGMRDSHLSNMTFQSGAQSSASSIRGGVPMSKAEIVRQQQMAASESRGPLRHVIQQHADAGTVVADDDVDTVIEEVPPSYNPQWASSGPSERGPSPLSSSGPRKN
jgi:hypothetical protein